MNTTTIRVNGRSVTNSEDLKDLVLRLSNELDKMREERDEARDTIRAMRRDHLDAIRHDGEVTLDPMCEQQYGEDRLTCTRDPGHDGEHGQPIRVTPDKHTGEEVGCGHE